MAAPTFDDLLYTFDDMSLLGTFDGFFTDPVSIIYLEATWDPTIELTGSP